MPDDEISLDALGSDTVPEPNIEHLNEETEEGVDDNLEPEIQQPEIDLETAYRTIEKNRPDLLAAHTQKQVAANPDYEDDPNLTYEDQVAARARIAMSVTMKIARDVRTTFPELPEEIHQEVEKVLANPSLTLAQLQELDRTRGIINYIGGHAYQMAKAGQIKMPNQIPSKPVNTPSPAVALKAKSKSTSEETQAMAKFAEMLGVPEKDLVENYQARKAK